VKIYVKNILFYNLYIEVNTGRLTIRSFIFAHFTRISTDPVSFQTQQFVSERASFRSYTSKLVQLVVRAANASDKSTPLTVMLKTGNDIQPIAVNISTVYC